MLIQTRMKKGPFPVFSLRMNSYFLLGYCHFVCVQTLTSVLPTLYRYVNISSELDALHLTVSSRSLLSHLSFKYICHSRFDPCNDITFSRNVISKKYVVIIVHTLRIKIDSHTSHRNMKKV